MTRDEADGIALRGLAFVLSDDDRAARFLAMSGLDQAALIEAARRSDGAVLGGVLDFLLDWEPDLLTFCAEAGLEPELPSRARRVLPGGPVAWE